MAAPTTLPALLDSLSSSLTSALEATPKLSGVGPSKDGLSLLDVKNELILSYLQNLVFLILVKLRNARNGTTNEEEGGSLDDLVVKKLVELRVYLEKGVRPIEDKLRYQIEKVLRAADDAERDAKAIASKQMNGNSDEDSESGSDDENSSGDDEDQDEGASKYKFSDLQYRPNLAAFVRPENASSGKKDKTGVYKPPRVAPTVMPTTERREKAERKPMKSATLDEFVADELSTAPVSEPSIGTTIVAGGRKIKTASERKQETERTNYEENNFVRLPKESKKDMAKKARREGRNGRVSFGGEEWRDLAEGVDRISRLTKGKSSGSGTRALLEKSRKRGPETTDGPRGNGSGGVEIGERYQKRLKLLDSGRGDKGRRK
ncbi:hypothetical protein GQ53DRAFT_741085 [Thozetella sp. PMI_491]|nr:hypothetical protein GQ53DRAFT_741085 [Thozetella sp. PMI_491]